MDFTPHTNDEIKEMLAAVGAGSLEDLFKGIPEEIPRVKLDLPEGLSEQELVAELKQLGRLNISADDYDNYLGAGSYQHFIPQIVTHLAGRGEFATAYTPYQAEASQGTLQTIYEYQTLICQLTGMDISNASLYDGATALAEALLAVCRARSISGGRIMISRTVHPSYREVVKTYLDTAAVDLVEIPDQNGICDIDFVKDNIDNNTIAVLVQNPNFFGCLEPVWEIPPLARKAGAASIISVNPISLGILRDPGSMGFDIAVGEGQSLGNPMMFGGPYLGFFACRKELLRKMPGRLVGRTRDSKGDTGFVLTLQTREQHIRREKATSNICSNEALCALKACIYLCALGKNGLRELAELNVSLSHYAKKKLCGMSGVRNIFSQPFFNEFVLHVPRSGEEYQKEKIISGLPLGRFYPELNGCTLWCVTETKSQSQIDRLVEVTRCK